MWGLLGFVSGALSLLLLPQLPAAWQLGLLLLLGLGVLGFRPAGLAPGALGYFTAWGLIAMALVGWRAQAVLAQQLPQGQEGGSFNAVGRVVGLPQYDGRAWRFRLSVDELSGPGGPLTGLGQLQLAYYPGAKAAPALVFKPGQRLHAELRLSRPRGFANPGGFDYQAFLLSQGVGARGYVRQLHSLGVAELPGWRWRLGQGIDAKPLLNGRFIRGLLLGDRSGLEADDWALLGQTGTGHLLAISGLHIGLVAALGFYLGLLLGHILQLWPGFGWGARALAWPCGLLVAAAYAYLAGFSLPTQRALIMLGLFCLAALSGRALSLPRALLLAMAAVLLLDPLAFVQAGACLSFFAVAVLAYGFSGRPARRGLWGGLLGLLKAQLLLGCFLPVCLYALGLANGQLGLPANLLAIPLLSFIILPLLLLAAVQEVVGPAWLWPWQWADFALACLLDYCQWLAGSDRRQALWWPPLAHSPWRVALLLSAAVLLWLPRGLPGRYLALLPLVFLLGRSAAISPGLPSASSFDSRPQPGLRIALLDVGQGLALVLERGGQVLLYDTGPRFSPRFNAGSAIIAPYLRRRGVSRIEQLIISHGDLDHAGGFEALAGQFAIGQLWVEPSELGRYRGHQPRACVRGRRWHWQGVAIEALWPAVIEPGASKAAYKRNNRSCVLLLRFQGLKLLLSGDIEAWAERRMLGPELAGVDILLAPHHGSNSSSHPAWAELTRPRWLLSSAAYRSRYGHPHPKVLARYPGSAKLNTASDGALVFNYRADARGRWHLQGPWRARREGRRYWYSAD